MTAAPPAEKLYSVAEYHGLGDAFLNGVRTELIRGRILDKMSASPEHSYLVDSLEEVVNEALGPGLLVRRERAMTLADSEVEPDVSVVAGRSRAEYRHHHPPTALLIMEVSVTTEERDREKITLYAEADVTEYWIVLPGRGRVEVCREPRGGTYHRTTVYRVGETVVSEVLPGLRVDVRELFEGPL